MTNDEILKKNDEILKKIKEHEAIIKNLRKKLNFDNLYLEEFGLSIRSANCMYNQNITTIGQLLKFSANDLREIKNFGRKNLFEIRNILKELGLHLRGDHPEWVKR